MQKFFEKFARLFYYLFFVATVLSGLFILWLLFWPLEGPGTEFYALALFAFLPVLLVSIAVETGILLLLGKLTKPNSSNPIANIVITVIFLIILTIALCYAYVNYL